MLYEEMEEEVQLLREQMDFVLEVLQAMARGLIDDQMGTAFENDESEAPNARD